MAQPAWLIIDQGGQSTRAVLFDAAGTVVGSCAHPIAITHSPQGHIEHDCDDVLNSIRQVVDGVLQGVHSSSIPAISAGLVTQRSSLVCWNRMTGEALTPVISWQDTRGQSWLRHLESSKDSIRARTGLVVNAHYGISKIRWCLDNLPAVKAGLDRGKLAIGPLAAYLVFKLTGKFRVDPANGSRTLLMNIHSQSWDPELLALVGIDSHCLPDIAPTRGDYGFIESQGQRLPLNLVNGDQSAAFNAYGPLAEGTAYINAGSGAFVASLLPEGKRAPETLLLSPVFCCEKGREQGRERGCQLVCEGTVNGAANALEFYRREWGLADYHGLDAWAEDYTEVPLFLNGVGGLGSPFWRADFKSGFIGEGNSQQKLLAIMESIAFMLCVNLEAMTRAGFPLERIYLSGGLSRYSLLAKRLFQLTGLPVYRGDDSGEVKNEATARGAAFQLAGFPAHWRQPVPVRQAFIKADTALDKTALARFEQWQKLMPAAGNACGL